jgi:hypothetical protein
MTFVAVQARAVAAVASMFVLGCGTLGPADAQARQMAVAANPELAA